MRRRDAGGLLRPALSEVPADQRTGRFLTGGVVVEAGDPGRRHVVRAGPSRAFRPVPRQGEPCLLPQGVQLISGPVRPVGVRLVGQQFVIRREGGREGIVSLLARRRRKPVAQRVRLAVGHPRDLRG